MGEARRRREQFRAAPPPCVYCAAPATTFDHVPPRALFVGRYPTGRHFRRVPSCEACARRTSVQDEEFVRLLGLRVAHASVTGWKFWTDRATPAFQRNARALRDLGRMVREAEILPDPAGRRSADAPRALRVDTAAHDPTIERLARGLYWREFNEIMPIDTPVRASWQRDDSAIREVFAPAKFVVMGGVFAYAVMRADDRPDCSMWAFNFYDGHFAAAVTGRKLLEDADRPVDGQD